MHANKASKASLKSHINEFDLIDIFRELNLFWTQIVVFRPACSTALIDDFHIH